MKKIKTSLFLGIIAGLLDTIPMIIQKLDNYAIISAFTQWIILSFIINYLDIKIKGWFKGFLISEIVIIPVLILVAKTEILSVVPIIITTAILGSLMGIANKKFISTSSAKSK